MEFDYPTGATPLSQDQANDLILTHITTREELNIWEQQNIYEATEWLNARLVGDLLNENVLGQPSYTWGGADLSAAGESIPPAEPEAWMVNRSKRIVCEPPWRRSVEHLHLI